MALARALIAEIPALRRFCRAIFGDVSRADVCLEGVLTKVLNGTISRFSPSLNGNAEHLRLNLLGSLIEALPERLDDDHTAGYCREEKSAQAIFKRIPKRPLIAFLLRSLEDLDDNEIAYVMAISPLQAHLLVELGSASIAGEIATKVLIIDGDPAATERIGSLVRELGHHVCGIAQRADEALRLTEVEQPGLIISELVFSDQSPTLPIFSELLKIRDVPLIIVTKYPETWNDTLGIYPAGLITKPFLNDAVRTTISSALFFNRQSNAPFWSYMKTVQINH